MTNRNKSKGSGYERRVAERLASLGWDAERRYGNAAGHDVQGVPWPVECKKRKRWEPQAWARYLTETHGDAWLLFMEPADKRSKGAPPEVVAMPWPLAEELLQTYFLEKET